MKNKKIKKVTISDFIDKNQKLISGIGIYGALSAFFINLGEDAKYLAFLNFSILVLVCWSAWSRLPQDSSSSIPLLMFGTLFWLLVVNLMVFYYKKFPSDFASVLPMILMFTFFWFIFEFKYGIRFFNYIKSKIKNKVIYNILTLFIIAMIAIISWEISSLLSKIVFSLIPLK